MKKYYHNISILVTSDIDCSIHSIHTNTRLEHNLTANVQTEILFHIRINEKFNLILEHNTPSLVNFDGIRFGRIIYGSKAISSFFNVFSKDTMDFCGGVTDFGPMDMLSVSLPTTFFNDIIESSEFNRTSLVFAKK